MTEEPQLLNFIGLGNPTLQGSEGSVLDVDIKIHNPLDYSLSCFS
jgi:hypothetical protein